MVITLCGSSKYEQEFKLANAYLSLKGNVVISLGIFGHSNKIEFKEEQKILLDDIHKQKIDISDEIFVIDVDKYIGMSTKSEIDYAMIRMMKIRYWSKEENKIREYLKNNNIIIWKK